jgi:hypothetical protein
MGSAVSKLVDPDSSRDVVMFQKPIAGTIDLVRARELEQRRTPSIPQLFVESAIANKLHELEDRLVTLEPPRADP